VPPAVVDAIQEGKLSGFHFYGYRVYQELESATAYFEAGVSVTLAALETSPAMKGLDI
jgi:hypothetical protein